MKVFYIIAGIILFCISLYGLNNPHTFFDIFESWRTKGRSEPSEDYINFMEIRFLISCVLGVILFIVGLMYQS